MNASGRLPTRQRAANCKKILKLFPIGFLPEEKAAQSRWPWATLPNAPDVASSFLPIPESLLAIETKLAQALASSDDQTDFAAHGQELTKWLASYINDEGFHLDNFRVTPAVLPSLVRQRIGLGSAGWTESLENCFRSIVTAVARLATEKAWLFGSGGGVSDVYMQMLQSIGNESGYYEWSNVARWLWNRNAPIRRTQPPTPAVQSDPAKLAILRRDWSQKSPVFGLEYQNPQCQLDVAVLGRSIMQGPWDTIISANDMTIPVMEQWDSTCWFADPDADYLELRMVVGSGLILERQIFLPRVIDLLWMCDTLKSSRQEKLELTWRLSMPAATNLTGTLPTRAQRLAGFGMELRVAPVGFPANPLSSAPGRISLEKGVLYCTTRAEGSRVVMPLVWSWDPELLPPQAEWRHLTITNDRRPVGPDEAVAYRFPHRDRQVIFFRALRQAIRYAFIGHQTYSESLIGEIDPDGDVHPWLMVE